jgi:NAD(P)-dependent dehydrogenase (short-subunit alcohol dehydrogenase family)
MSADGRFTDKVAIVTGAAGGIGSAICTRLAQEGARLVLVDRAPPKAGVPADSADVWCAPPTDVGHEDEVAAVFDGALERFGRIDHVVNNAAVMTFKPIEALTREDWYRVLDVNLLGAAYFTKYAFTAMRPGGSLVNVASVHAVQTSPLAAPYAASKAALCALTRSASIEGKPKGIRVNAILPGAVDTPMLWDNPNVSSGAEQIAAAYIGAPAEIAAAVAYLLSDDASFVSGAALVVDGGGLASL